jgi:hypothetical protein
VKVRFKIGPAAIEILAARSPHGGLPPNYVPFVDRGNDCPALSVRVRTDLPPEPGDAPLIGELDTQWRLYAQDIGLRLEVLDQINFLPKQVGLFSCDLNQVDVHVLQYPKGMPNFPQDGWGLEDLMTPLIQWWLTAWVVLKAQGMILHASAVSIRDKGLAFVGPSGAGKTTSVRHCRDGAGTTVLNDDRIVVWKEGETWKVSGTPWHGAVSDVSSITVPLGRLCMLRKARANRFVPLTQAQLLNHLIPEAFLPIWSREGMERLLETSARLANDVPCGELQCVNDPSLAAYLLGLVEAIPRAASVGSGCTLTT